VNPAGGASAWANQTIDTFGLTTVACPTTTTCIALDGLGNAMIGHLVPPPTSAQIGAALQSQISLIAKQVRLGPQKLWPSDHLGLVARFALQRRRVTVMSYNVFQGSELSHSFAATTSAQLGPAVAADYENAVRSHIPARARALAAEIQRNHPVVVGLQDAVLWRTAPAGPQPYAIPGTATHVSYDFVQLLLGALAARGVQYRVVAITNTHDLQATGDFPGGQRMDVRYTDRVAILVRADVAVSNLQDHNYTAGDTVSVLGGQLGVPDGWASVDLKVVGRRFRFITTHLDGLSDPQSDSVRAAEASEIITGPANTKLPVIFTCDCSSTPSTKTYEELAAAGLRDTWVTVHPHLPGLTCCHRSNPTDPEPNVADPIPRQGIVERTDYIWNRPPFVALGIKRIGLNPADRALTEIQAFSSNFNAPIQGVFTENCYRPQGNHTRVLIATGAATLSGGPATVEITLTAAGRHLLRTAKRPVGLTVVASFAPLLGPHVTVRNHITLQP
jgi:hypothetical protein